MVEANFKSESGRVRFEIRPLEIPRSEIIGVNQLNFEEVFSSKSAEFNPKKVLTKIQFSKNRGSFLSEKNQAFF